MTLFKPLTVVVVMLTTSFTLPGFAKSQNMTKCWYIEQHNQILGDNQIYATPQAVKIVFFNKKWVDFAKAPDWELYVFNPSSKVYWHTPLNKWKGTALLQSASAIDRKIKPTKTSETKKIAGFTATKYTAKGIDAAKGDVESEEYWVTKDMAVPKQISHIVSSNADVPDTDGGFPLVVNVSRFKEKTVRTINTLTAKQTTVPEDFFKLPSGYKYTDKPEVVMSGGVINLLQQLITE